MPHGPTFVRATLAVLLAVTGAGLGCSRADRRPRAVPPPRPLVDASVEPRFVSPAEVPLRWEGRIDLRDPSAPRFAWPASGFRLRFRGTGLVLRMREVSYEDVIRDTDYLAVYVDQRAPITIALQAGVLDYTVAHGLAPGHHEVRVLKRTEAEVGTITLTALSLEGGGEFSAAPPPRPHRMLAIGDSITAGYGIDGPDAFCHYGAGTSNATRTYAFLAAQELDAEYQAIAWSGRGVYRNNDATIPELIPQVFERQLATDAEPSFSADAYQPTWVVVNLGTNDLSQPNFERARFYAAYRAFLIRLRNLYPDAHLVLIVGPMLADDYPPQSRALSKARRAVLGLVAERRARGDSAISYLEMFGASPEEGYGCDYHPSLATHRRMADALVAHVRSLPR